MSVPAPFRSPATREQALTEALFLGLMATDDARARRAAALAESLAVGMDAATVEMCKAHALERFEFEDA